MSLFFDFLKTIVACNSSKLDKKLKISVQINESMFVVMAMSQKEGTFWFTMPFNKDVLESKKILPLVIRNDFGSLLI